MKYLIIVAALLLTGCNSLDERLVCDSGYETPWSEMTSINKGVIWYRAGIGEPVTYRKMLGGEICKKERR